LLVDYYTGNRYEQPDQTEGVTMTMDFLTNEEIVIAARRNLGQGPWDYLVGGSESETTLRRNRLAFDRWAFRPRILRDVSKVDASTSFLGHHLRIPVLLAPIGSLQVFSPEGGVAVARAAGEFGTMHVVSTATQPGLEEIQAASEAPKIFQLYVRGDDAWVRDLLQRAAASGYKAIALTVDSAVDSLRERPILTRWVRPSRRVAFEPIHQASLTWEKMDWIRSLTNLPFLLKGVQTAEDAEIAVQHGVDVIWVSNHGGRQLDHGQGSLEVLPEVVEAVAGRAEVIVDGGIQRGSDVLKAMALGANAVAIGRLQTWGLAAAGSDGVRRVLEILETEIMSAMGLTGVTSIGELGPQYLTRSESVTPPHEMSAWVNMPKYGGRIDGRIL
jgi:isopentenyl diphosphate isomerase/L-lactate dehydrogenase-like FMN-dependent dehydrogenase